MVAATLEIYQIVQRELLPTPEKSHYTFNLRDLGKVYAYFNRETKKKRKNDTSTFL
jgi:hypothetical protein